MLESKTSEKLQVESFGQLLDIRQNVESFEVKE